MESETLSEIGGLYICSSPMTPSFCAPELQLNNQTKKIFAMPTVHLLDYVAGNVRSLVNAIEKLGWTVEWVKSPADVAKADVRLSA
jgi:hypothetical protein